MVELPHLIDTSEPQTPNNAFFFFFPERAVLHSNAPVLKCRPLPAVYWRYEQNKVKNVLQYSIPSHVILLHVCCFGHISTGIKKLGGSICSRTPETTSRFTVGSPHSTRICEHFFFSSLEQTFHQRKCPILGKKMLEMLFFNAASTANEIPFTSIVPTWR